MYGLLLVVHISTTSVQIWMSVYVVTVVDLMPSVKTGKVDMTVNVPQATKVTHTPVQDARSVWLPEEVVVVVVDEKLDWKAIGCKHFQPVIVE